MVHLILSNLKIFTSLGSILNISSSSLFLVQRGFMLIKSRLKLVLDLVQMVHLILSNLKIFTSLGSILIQVLLLLIQLVNDLLLVGNLIIQASDGVVTVGLLLLQLLDGHINIFNVLLYSNNFLLKNLFVSSGSLSLSFLLNKEILCSNKLVLQICLLGRHLGLLLMVLRHVTLLLLNLLDQSLDFFLGADLLFKKTQFFLRVRLANHGSGLLDNDKPSPFPHANILSEVSLGNLDKFPLVTLLEVNYIPESLESLTLHVADKLQDNVISLLLQEGKGTSAEEDKSVSKTIPLTRELNLVHKSIGASLVVIRAGNFSSSKDSISCLKVRVQHPVRESSHANPDTFKHTITSQLVHDKRRLYISRLLVGVGHKATHKVRLTRVQGGHELSKRHQVNRGDSLTATSLLLLLSFFLGGDSGLSRVVSPQVDKQINLRSRFENFNNRVIDRILVLLKPVGDIVGHNTSIMGDGKVSILVSLGLGLQEDGELAKGSLQLLLKGLVSSLREERLLLKDGPVNALLDIFLLFHNEHVVVEELLELLIDKVDGNLLKAIVLKDLKSSNVKHSTEVVLLKGGIN